ncbi:hypothetical protein AAFF_G00019570 [Aldrovandia affinis]|uniref:Uncharacterized protein n=1 Tax=Aldrovandia affinis TaxID=143900 RepID=A0AAD7S5M8_9TELE|nr:hypothetical protein AAFF_G00019570 [Aldrovandia affinis]
MSGSSPEGLQGQSGEVDREADEGGSWRSVGDLSGAARGAGPLQRGRQAAWQPPSSAREGTGESRQIRANTGPVGPLCCDKVRKLDTSQSEQGAQNQAPPCTFAPPTVPPQPRRRYKNPQTAGALSPLSGPIP